MQTSLEKLGIIGEIDISSSIRQVISVFLSFEGNLSLCVVQNSSVPLSFVSLRGGFLSPQLPILVTLLFNDFEYGGNHILRGTTFSKYKQFVQNCFKILPRQALHATELSFLHPADEKNVMFHSNLPDDMQTVINRWRNYIDHI